MPALVERPKLTKMMYKVLQQHIMRERERKKQEQEQDEMMERLKKERELKKKKEEKDNLNLEQTKEQIQKLEQKLESLKQEKHTLFLKLKKILNQEEETRKRAQMKEQSELSLQQNYPPPSHGLPVTGHQVMLQPGSLTVNTVRPQLYKPQHIMHQPVKRQRSPSPTPPHSSSYQTYGHSEAKYPHSTYPQQGKPAPSHPSIYQHQQPDYSKRQPGATYPQSQTSHVVYASQTGASYQPGVTYTSGQSQAGKYNPANQSAFQSYPNHYTHQQKVIGEAYSQGYAISRQQQPAYLNSPHSTNLQQLEHQKTAAFNEDKFKMQQSSIRNLAPMSSQQAPLIQQLQLQQAAPKGSIVTGYPARTQGSSTVPVTSYQQPTTAQSNFSNQQGGRTTYSNPGMYFPGP